MRLEIQFTDAEKILAPLNSLPRKIPGVIQGALKRAGVSLASRIARSVKARSYLKASAIKAGIGKPQLSQDAVEVRVAAKAHGADSFKLIPKKITARKGSPSKTWPLTLWQAGPNLPVWQPKRNAGQSHGFVIPGLLFMQREGKKLERVRGLPVQYFAVFEEVSNDALTAASQTFEKRLDHEVNRILGA